LLLELGDLTLVGGEPTLVLVVGRRDHLPPLRPYTSSLEKWHIQPRFVNWIA
jgi:hypothetical protein